jgi:PEP-CTERM motif
MKISSPLLMLSLATLWSATFASASGVVYTCDPNIDTGTCTTLNTTIAGIYGGAFTNANASIYIQYGNTGLGQSTTGYLNLVTYSDYLAALTSHEGPGGIDAAALASLPAIEPGIFGGGDIEVTSALAAALGITTRDGGGAIVGTTAAGAPCFTPGTGGCYNGIITLATPAIVAGYGQGYYYRSGVQAPNEYDIYAVVQHETDEVLGTSSCIGTTGGVLSFGCGGTNAAAVDLFRYSGVGTPVFMSNSAAYFSYDGGNTVVGTYNTLSNGQDYADWNTNCQHVQDATACLGQSLNIGSEIAVLDAIGFNQSNLTPSDVPEPATLGLFGSALALVIAYRKRP